MSCYVIPGDFLLQQRNIRNVEHDPKEEKRLVAILVQLLLESFLQLHPALSRGLGLSMEPQPEVVSLGQRRRSVVRRRNKAKTLNQTKQL